MRFEIKRAKNGYIVQADDEEHPFVFQEISDFKTDEVDAWASFLWELTSEYGPSTSKYSRKRIYIEVKPGRDCPDGWVRHVVIVQLRKEAVSVDEYRSILWNTSSIVMQIPGVRECDVFENESKYVPENVTSFGVEIIFEDQKAFDNFMEHPKHFEANALFEKYLADPPYMVLTHPM